MNKDLTTKSLFDKDLANYILSCPSYKQMDGNSRFVWLNNLLRPIFNLFQLERSRNNVKFYLSNMKSLLSQRLKNVPLVEKQNYMEYIENCVSNYYKLFKGKFYQRYKVLSFTTPYDTNIIPLNDNIRGDIDLIIKTSYGVTLLNHVYSINSHMFYYNVQLSATRLQIAARCMKLITGIEPDLLCLLIFTKRHIFKRYFKYTDEPYENYLTLYNQGLIPIKKRYCILCKTCTVERCAPWRTNEQILI